LENMIKQNPAGYNAYVRIYIYLIYIYKRQTDRRMDNTNE